MSAMDQQQFLETLRKLIDAWCDRRAFRALRCVLPGYPPSTMLTDGLGELLTALQNVRAFAREEITPAELQSLDECIRVLERSIYRH
jgi:hypothetical protein